MESAHENLKRLLKIRQPLRKASDPTRSSGSIRLWSLLWQRFHRLLSSPLGIDHKEFLNISTNNIDNQI